MDAILENDLREELKVIGQIASIEMSRFVVQTATTEEIDAFADKLREITNRYKEIMNTLDHMRAEAKKKQQTLLLQGLAEYFYHPTRIQKWLDGGNELEDYLE